jgi:hypothetical protein
LWLCASDYFVDLAVFSIQICDVNLGGLLALDMPILKHGIVNSTFYLTCPYSNTELSIPPSATWYIMSDQLFANE